MEFIEKLQGLRKQKGITQEDLAEILCVSRTAISKWESGRGYPNIDSLKAISKYFGVTIDDLLSGEELIIIAEEDSKQKQKHISNLVFGLLDCSIVLLFFLPMFGQKIEESVREVSLLSLVEVATYLRIIYFLIVIAIVVWGVLELALQNWHKPFWKKSKCKISLILNILGTLLFIISSQPYAAILLFVFLIIKVLMLVKS